MRAEAEKGPQMSDSGWLDLVVGRCGIDELLEHAVAECHPSARAKEIQRECVRLIAALRHAHEFAGRAAVEREDIGTIKRGGRELKLYWTEGILGAGVWFSARRGPDATFYLPAGTIAALADVVAKASRLPRPRSLTCWGADGVTVQAADGALHVFARDHAWHDATVRIDWRDLPAFLAMLRKAAQLAAAWEARKPVGSNESRAAQGSNVTRRRSPRSG